jgi:hypothetical protein
LCAHAIKTVRMGEARLPLCFIDPTEMAELRA